MYMHQEHIKVLAHKRTYLFHALLYVLILNYLSQMFCINTYILMHTRTTHDWYVQSIYMYMYMSRCAPVVNVRNGVLQG